MKRIPCLYNSEVKENLLTLTTRVDKVGNVYHYVEYQDNDGSNNYARFSNLSSAIDFISSNFK